MLYRGLPNNYYVHCVFGAGVGSAVVALGRPRVVAVAEGVCSGTTAQVRLAVDADGRDWAIKIVNKDALDDEDMTALLLEVSVCEKLVHPNVVNLHQLIETDSRMYLVRQPCLALTPALLFRRHISARNPSPCRHVCVWP